MAIATQHAAPERKSERMELRMTPTARDVIERAMAFSGLSAGDLAYEGARRIIEDHERMVLADADRESLVRALMKPPKPAPRLVSAMKRRNAIK
jgi:uncharacterized protein (DUF1778 family)